MGNKCLVARVQSSFKGCLYVDLSSIVPRGKVMMRSLNLTQELKFQWNNALRVSAVCLTCISHRRNLPDLLYKGSHQKSDNIDEAQAIRASKTFGVCGSTPFD